MFVMSFLNILIRSSFVSEFINESKFWHTLLGYSLITDDGWCNHVEGGFPTNCKATSVLTHSKCEELCTSQTSCIGYSFIRFEGACYLHPSISSCPPNFQLNDNLMKTYNYKTKKREVPHTATSKNDLVARPSAFSVCYGKN